MSYSERKGLIYELEKIRKSRVLSYVLSDRQSFPPGVPGLSEQLGSEAQLKFVDQLRRIGKSERLDLFLYTRGGAQDSVWPLVSLLREYCDKLSVIVPFRAHSGGTLICIGADEIIMTDFAELSPIDPTTGNLFNPIDPANPQNRLGISVEDVAAYFKLSADLAGIKKESYRLDVLKELTGSGKVHPLALGNVQRVYLQIRELAQKLLMLHINEKDSANKIKEIIQALTEKFYSHLHAINRREAHILLGDWVKSPTKDEEVIILKLFDLYVEALSLGSKFNLPEYMGDNPIRDLSNTSAFIESTKLSFIHKTDVQIMQRPNLPKNIQIQVPPGQPVPLKPWVSRSYDFGVNKMGWQINDSEV